MNKTEFLAQLRERLSGLSREEMEERLLFYNEMIDDRMEEGLSEAEAVAAVGTVEEVAAQILGETTSSFAVCEKQQSKRKLKAWEIVLLILGSPVWFSLLVAAFAVVISLYISVWAVIVSLWAVFGSVVACAVGVLICGVLYLVWGDAVAGVAVIGASLACAGLTIFLFWGCKAVTDGTLTLTKKLAAEMKRRCTGKERA